MQAFLEQVAEVLEVPEVKPEDDFRATPMWGSLTGFALEERAKSLPVLARYRVLD